MASAALRGTALFALGCLFANCGEAASGGARSTPARPGGGYVTARSASAPRVSLRVGSIEYVSATDVAVWLGLQGKWTEPLHKLVLTSKADASRKLELEADSRTALVDGLRIDLGNAAVLKGGRLYVSRTDVQRTLAPLMNPYVLPSPPSTPTVIALDAGHGGGDNGMENPRLGLKEKVLALDVVLRVKKLLEAAGYKIVLTRKTDAALSPEKKRDLSLRAEIANRAGADLLVSVHFNSLFPDTKTGGTEVYVYTPPEQRSSEAWGIGKVDDSKPPQPVNRYDAWSSLLAHRLHRNMLASLRTTDRGQKTKHLFLFQDLNCPAALVESVFLSNDSEARRAATPQFRQKIAEAVAEGIREYASSIAALQPRPGTGSAATRRRHHPRSS